MILSLWLDLDAPGHQAIDEWRTATRARLGERLAAHPRGFGALVYVLANFRKHASARLGPGVDAFSSAAHFDGWRGRTHSRSPPRAGPAFHRALAPLVVLSAAKTWLATVGWRRAGLLRFDEAPAR